MFKPTSDTLCNGISPFKPVKRPYSEAIYFLCSIQASIKCVLLINLKLLTIAKSILLDIPNEHPTYIIGIVLFIGKGIFIFS